MKMNNLLVGSALVALCIASGSQLYAAIDGKEGIETNVVYEIADTSKSFTSEEAEKEKYNQQCFEALEKYFGITKDQMPKNAKFNVIILSQDFLDKEKAANLKMIQGEIDSGKITQADFEKYTAEIKKEYEQRCNYLKSINREDVTCMFRDTTGKNQTNCFYNFRINPNTKEVYFALIPMSDKGWNTQKDVVGPVDGPSKAYSVSADVEATRKAVCESYIKKHQLGGIETAVFVKIHGATSNHYIYKDANDDSKYVMIMFDTAETNRVVSFETDANEVKESFLS